MIERKILIGLISSTQFLKEIKDDWKDEYMESSTAKTLARWCWTYFNKYNKAPMRDIDIIFTKKLKKGIDEDLAEDIEEILHGLSEEYEQEGVDITMLVDETHAHFIERQIHLHHENLEALIGKGQYEEAEKLVDAFKLRKFEKDDVLDLGSPEVYAKIDEAYNEEYQSLIRYPGALGRFWNDQLVRGALVGILAPEKRGKTFWLLDFLMRAVKQGKKVLFFQAGDMTEIQQLRRVGIYLARKSNKERYCGTQYLPITDCIHNQMDTCTKKIRESSFGIFSEKEEEQIREITFQELLEAYNGNPDYKNCFNCTDFAHKSWGVPWLHKINIPHPLTNIEAKKHHKRFFKEQINNVKISTHANGTLTLSKMDAIMDKLERQGFVADVVLVDYGDLLESETKMEERHKQNYIWKGLRRRTQERNNLWIVPSQADAISYEQNTLKLKNFSEDKRKYAHATAWFGLNQDAKGREKKLGIMRINALMLRDDDFEISNHVKVLHRLEIGRPFLGSYF